MNSNIYKNKKTAFFFIVPAFIFLIIYLYYPFIRNIINSFQEINGLGDMTGGFKTPWYSNYVEMIQDQNMWVALKNTGIMIVSTVIIQVGLAIVLALMVDNIRHGAKFFRVVFFFPIVISATALGVLFNIIFLYDQGMINQMISAIHTGDLINWKDEAHAMFTLLAPVMWQYVGFYFVIILTGLNNIDEELYEAAAIDGASRWQRVRYISIPMIRGVIGVSVTLAVTGALKVFDLPWVMFPKGMPLGKTWLTGTYMYYHAFNTKNVDYSSAIAVVIVVLGVILAQIINKVTKSKEETL